jgi:hypothetical protein
MKKEQSKIEGEPGKTVCIDGALCKITARDWTEETSPCLINHNGVDLPPFTVRAFRCVFDILRGGGAARLVVMPPWLTSNTAHMNPVAVTSITPVKYENGLGGGGTLNALVRFAEMDVARRCFVEILPTAAPTAEKPEAATCETVCTVCGWKHTSDFTRWENPHTGAITLIGAGTLARMFLEGLHVGMKRDGRDVATAAAMGDKKSKAPRVADIMGDKESVLFQSTGRGRGKIRPPDPGKAKKTRPKR